MRTDRLLKLADALEANAANPTGIKFDLDLWGQTIGEEVKAPTMDCNTTACAWGFAAISGIFKDEGVSYEIYLTDESDHLEICPTYEAAFGMDAAGKFFEIWENACVLFSPSYYPIRTPTSGAEGERVVAKRIRDVVADPKLLETLSM